MRSYAEKSSDSDGMLANVGNLPTKVRFLTEAPYSKPANCFFRLYGVVPSSSWTYDRSELPPQRLGDRIGGIEKILDL